MTSLEARIQVLEDKDAIRELTAKYCYTVVRQDSQALINMFTEDGDSATGNCAVEIRLVDEGKAFTVCGHYDDVYRRVNGEWKFARRDFELYHWVPLAEGWAGQG